MRCYLSAYCDSPPPSQPQYAYNTTAKDSHQVGQVITYHCFTGSNSNKSILISEVKLPLIITTETSNRVRFPWGTSGSDHRDSNHHHHHHYYQQWQPNTRWRKEKERGD